MHIAPHYVLALSSLFVAGHAALVRRQDPNAALAAMIAEQSAKDAPQIAANNAQMSKNAAAAKGGNPTVVSPPQAPPVTAAAVTSSTATTAAAAAVVANVQGSVNSAGHPDSGQWAQSKPGFAGNPSGPLYAYVAPSTPAVQAGFAVPTQSPGPYVGDATNYLSGSSTGSCGWPIDGTQKIVALCQTFYDKFGSTANSNNNPLCGRKVKITTDTGATDEATIVDRTVTCSTWDLDMSQNLFFDTFPFGDGRVGGVKWELL